MASSKDVLSEALQRLRAREERTELTWNRCNAICAAAVGKFAEAMLGEGFCRERNAEVCGVSVEGTVSWRVNGVAFAVRVEPGRARVIVGDETSPASLTTFYLPEQLDNLAEHIALAEWEALHCRAEDNGSETAKEGA